MNLCVEYALAEGRPNDVFLCLNNDVETDEEYISVLVRLHAKQPRALIGSVAVRQDDPSILVQAEAMQDWRSGKNGYRRVIGSRINGDARKLVEVAKLSGRGTLVPLSVYREIGLYDAEAFPQYAADEDFAIRAGQIGYKLLLSYEARVRSDYEATGLASEFHVPRISTFIRSLVSRRSSNNLLARTRFAFRHCPRKYLLQYLILSSARLIGGFLKRYVKFHVSANGDARVRSGKGAG